MFIQHLHVRACNRAFLGGGGLKVPIWGKLYQSPIWHSFFFLTRVSWMQEGRKCIFVILWEKQFCAQIFFVFHCFLTSCFVHKNVNTLSWDLCYYSKCVILHVLSISTTNLISPTMSLTTFLHSHDEIYYFVLLESLPPPPPRDLSLCHVRKLYLMLKITKKGHFMSLGVLLASVVIIIQVVPPPPI